MRRSAEFVAVMRRGRRAGRSTMVLHLLPGATRREGDDAVEREQRPAGGSDGPARVGFVVSRAVGNAVTRNRVRRRLRALVRARLQELPPDSLLVVRALPASVAATSTRLRSDFDAALERLLASSRTASEPSTSTGRRPR